MLYKTLDNIIKYFINILSIDISNKKYRLKLLLKLNTLLQKKQQNNIVIQEIFKKYFKIHLTSQQINELKQDNNALEIIEYLKKFPNIIIYENRKLSYTRSYQNKINKTSNIFWYIAYPMLIVGTILSLYIAISNLSIQYVIITITLIIYISLMYNYNQDFKKLEKLIEKCESV